jgi:ABC-2 type transport system permease protein
VTSALEYVDRAKSPLDAARHRLRVLWVIAVAEFKLKYTGSVLGYVWSVLRPLALFTLLYLVFGRVFDLNELSPYYGVALLIGIVLFTFFSDATTLALISIVARDAVIRKLAFPRFIIPSAATVTALLTLLINWTVVLGFVFFKGITPTWEWLLLPLLLVELYAYVLGVGLLLSALYVRLRDLQQVWDLALQLFFYASPIVYPVGFLPPEVRKIIFLNPFTQILQDVRSIVLYPDDPENIITANDVYGTFGRLIPLSVVVALLVAGYVVFRREEPWFAERV